MRDYISIGPTPGDEDCQQLGQDYDEQKARAECDRFLALIKKVVGEEPTGATLAVKTQPHDFGCYLEVVCYYDDNDEEAVEYAFRCEEDAPTEWEQEIQTGGE